MIEVTLWMSGREGDGVLTYLINVPTETADGGFVANDYFTPQPSCLAIRRALNEYQTVKHAGRITRIDVRVTPDKVLLP